MALSPGEETLLALLDRHAAVSEVAHIVAAGLRAGGDADVGWQLWGALCCVRIGTFIRFRWSRPPSGSSQSGEEPDGGTPPDRRCPLYLAAHVPTQRAQDQTYRIAERLHQGERLYEELES